MATFMDKYFPKFQCGFRKGYSTQRYLFALIEKKKSAVDSGNCFGALLTELLLTKLNVYGSVYTTQKMKFSLKYFFSKCDQIRRKLRIFSHLLKKSLMENLIFCAVLSALKLNSSYLFNR